jgi:hypothetical protein
MDVSIGTLIGQLVGLALVIALIVVVVRLLIAAVRVMNNKSRLLERQHAQGHSRDSDSS